MRGFRERPPSTGSAPQSAQKPTGKEKVTRHCRRWWWAYLLALIIVAVLIIFPVLYSAFPNKAQDAINQADLIVTSQSIVSPAPNSFYLNQNTLFMTNSSQSANLDAWDANLCLDPQCQYPFAQVKVPKAEAKNGTHIDIAQITEIFNTTEFNKYTQIALGSEAYDFYLKGEGKLHKGAWPSTIVHYDKKITMKGLNALRGFNLSGFQIIDPPLDDGTNANGTIYIPNPSVSTYEMGDVTLNMSVDSTPIGTSFLKDLILIQGANEISMTAITNQTAIAGLVLGAYKSGILPIDLVGSSVTFQKNHILWYEQALQALPLRVNLNVTLALQEAGLLGMLGPGPPPTLA